MRACLATAGLGLHYLIIPKRSYAFAGLAIFFSAFAAGGDLVLELYLMAALTHPTHNLGRVADHKGIIRYILGHDSTCADKGVSTYGMPANDRGIGTNCNMFPFVSSRSIC